MFVPTTPEEIPRTRAIAIIKRLKQTTMAILSFRCKLKDAVRSTITGIDITKKAHQRDSREEFRGLRIASVTISDATE